MPPAGCGHPAYNDRRLKRADIIRPYGMCVNRRRGGRPVIGSNSHTLVRIPLRLSACGGNPPPPPYGRGGRGVAHGAALRDVEGAVPYECSRQNVVGADDPAARLAPWGELSAEQTERGT